MFEKIFRTRDAILHLKGFESNEVILTDASVVSSPKHRDVLM